MLSTHRRFGYCRAGLAQHQGFLFFPTLPPTASRLRVGTKLGGDTTWAANPNWPREYSMSYNTMLNKKNWGKGIFQEVVIGRRLAAHQSACGTWWVIAFASLWGFSLPLSLNYLSVFISNHEFPHICSSYALRCPPAVGNEQAAVVLSSWQGSTHHRGREE